MEDLPLIRMATLEDAAVIAAIYGYYVENTVISFEEIAPTAEEMKARIANVVDHLPWLVAELDGRIVGYAYASLHKPRASYRWSVDSGIYLEASQRGKGIGKVLYRRLFTILAKQGYRNVMAGVTLPNDASVGLHESFGFKQVALYSHVGYKFEKWHDVGWYQMELSLGAWNSDPDEPERDWLKYLPYA